MESVLGPGEAPRGPSLHFFTTGQGNVICNPIVPVIEITPNPHTVGTMGEHIDVDRTGLLAGEIGLEEAASLILETFERTTRGRLTAAEVLGHREFVPTKLCRSA